MSRRWARISDYLWFQEGPGVRNYQYVDSGVKLLNVANLSGGRLNISNTSRHISEEEAYGRYKHFLVDEGDFIIASSGIKVDYFDEKMGFARASDLPLCMNTSTIRFKVLDDSELDIRYFMYYLKSQSFKRQLAKQITGSAQLNFGPSHLKKMLFPVADKEIQQTIVLRLDSIEGIIERLKDELRLLDDLVKSRFVEMFGDGRFPLSPIASFAQSKMPAAKKVFSQDETIRYIDISSIDNETHEIIGTTEFIFSEAPSRAQQCIDAGDLLISTVRPNLRNVAINRFDAKNLVASSGFCILRCMRCPVEYMKAIVCSDGFTEAMCKLTTGANYPAIKTSDVISYMIPDAPAALMDEYAAFVQQVDKSKSVVQKSIEQLELLKASLMQECFG